MRADLPSQAEIALAAAFVNAHVGKPWRKGACGPDEFNCWGIVSLGERELFGRSVPLIDVDEDNTLAVARAVATSPLRQTWPEVEQPKGLVRPWHGDIVSFSRATIGHHVGIFLAVDRGGVLHSARGAGVCFSTLPDLRLGGWGAFHLHRYAGEPCTQS